MKIEIEEIINADAHHAINVLAAAKRIGCTKEEALEKLKVQDNVFGYPTLKYGTGGSHLWVSYRASNVRVIFVTF